MSWSQYQQELIDRAHPPGSPVISREDRIALVHYLMTRDKPLPPHLSITQAEQWIDEMVKYVEKMR